MILPIPTHRDILVFQQEGSVLTIAADTLGAIGMKPADTVQAAPEICGQFTARVCLMETLAVGAVPFALMALTCNEREPTGAGLLAGIRQELSDAGYPDISVGGSTEDNMPTVMTALGITLLGQCAQPSWRMAEDGDYIYLFGQPYVGNEVLAFMEKLPKPGDIRRLRSLPAIGDIIPCGSRGIAWELQVLEKETGLKVQLAPGLEPSLLTKSAGPATCAIITSSASLSGPDSDVLQLGMLTDN